MSKLAWIYIWTVLLLGGALCVWSLLSFDYNASTTEFITFLVLTGFATVSQLFEASHGKQSYYPHFVFFLAGVFLLQPLLFALLVILPHAIEWAKERLTNSEHLRNWYLQPFNIATHILAGWAAWWTNHAITVRLNSAVDASLASPILPIASALCGVLVYVTINHATVGQALVLARKISWRQSGVMRWQSIQPDFIMSCLGFIVAILWQLNPWLIFPALSPLVLMYQALMVPQLKQEAQTDGKTSLLNARYFSMLYQSMMERAKRFDRPVALIMADLDLLRNINNTYGHLAGDAVLAGIGQIIRDTVREFDIAGRFGGEEFAIALPEAGPLEARILAEKLRLAVEAAVFKVPNNTTEIQVTMSLGVACYPEDAVTPADLIHQADVAVYQAKLNGRNCVVCGSEVPHSIDFASAPMSERLSSPYSGSGTFVPRPHNTGALPKDVPDAPAPLHQATSRSNGVMLGTTLTLPQVTSSFVPMSVAAHSEAPIRPAAGGTNILSKGTAPLIMPVSTLAAGTQTMIAAAVTAPATAFVTENYTPPVPVQPQAATAVVPTRMQKAVFPMFISSVIAAGVAFAVTGLFMRVSTDPMAIGLFVTLAVVAELLQVDLYGRGTISVSASINFAAALVTGLPGLALVSAAIVLAHRLRQGPAVDLSSLYKTAFNWSTHLLAGVAPVLVMHLLHVPFTLTNLPLLLVPVLLSSISYFVVDTALIATVISLVGGDNPLKIWTDRYRWLAGHYLALCVMGLFLGMAYSGLGPTGVIVFTLPVLMLRFAQKQYITQTEHSVRELQRMNEELTHANAEVLDASRTMQSLNEELFLTLSKIIDARDPYVGGHASKVADYAVAIAQDLGVAGNRMEALRQAGFLHDIGKIAISEAVLHKPARLTDEEYEYIKTHAALGGEFVEMCRGLRHLAPFVRHHHERWDGKGYPDMLVGDGIPLEARILAVCDSVEAMASDRPYRKGMSLDEVIAEVKRCSGTQFDPAVAASFVRIAERERDHLIVNSAIEVERKQAQNDAVHHKMGNPSIPEAAMSHATPEQLQSNSNGRGFSSGASLKSGPLATGPLTQASLNAEPVRAVVAS